MLTTSRLLGLVVLVVILPFLSTQGNLNSKRVCITISKHNFLYCQVAVLNTCSSFVGYSLLPCRYHLSNTPTTEYFHFPSVSPGEPSGGATQQVDSFLLMDIYTLYKVICHFSGLVVGELDDIARCSLATTYYLGSQVGSSKSFKI